jgi:hypothetical protein
MMFTMETTQRMMDLRKEIVDLDLDAEPEFREASINSLLEIYNGCGPDWLPEGIRDLLTSHYAFFEPAFVIHDWDYTKLPKTEKDFHRANERLFTNCVRIIRAKVPAWRFIQRWKRMAQANNIFEACEEWGLDGYMEAGK